MHDVGHTNTSVPAGSAYPPSVSAAIVRRVSSHPGGYRRIASSTACIV